jgi:GNAT superfamily N-acetyltransferase
MNERPPHPPRGPPQGYAGAIVRRIALEARGSGLGYPYLLAEHGAEAVSFYERLGFEAIGNIPSTLRPLR